MTQEEMVKQARNASEQEAIRTKERTNKIFDMFLVAVTGLQTVVNKEQSIEAAKVLIEINKLWKSLN